MTPCRPPCPPAARRCAGFTLIEVLVVMVIVTVLAGVVIAAAARMRQQSQINQAEIALQAAKSIDVAYRAELGYIIRYTGTSNPEEASIATFVNAVQQLPETRKMLMAIGKGLVINDPKNDPSDTNDAPDIIVDPWGKPLQYRSWVSDADPVNTVHASSADSDGSGNLPRRGTEAEPQPYFASAGPDGKWGQTDPATGEPDAAAADNIYSFELD